MRTRLLNIYCQILKVYYSVCSTFSQVKGVTAIKRTVPLIVSLTTIPERMPSIHLCLESLLQQECKPDYIFLWLSEESKNSNATVSRKLLKRLNKLEKRGITIRYCRDIGSYRKIIFTLKEYPKSIIVTADDDVFYSSKWLSELYELYLKDPLAIYCHRAHKITFNNDGTLKSYNHWEFFSLNDLGPSHLLFPTGVGGVLYPPNCFYHDVLDESIFMQLCPRGDDIWLRAMTLLKDYPCRKVRKKCMRLYSIPGSQETSLWADNVYRNDQYIKDTFNYYNLQAKLRDMAT